MIAALLASVAAAAPATAVGVAEREFRIAVYRRSVPAGRVRFNVRNFGEDRHDLAVFGPRGFRPVRSPEIRAGRTYTLTATLRRPGRYRLVCTLADHERRGMKATLRVSSAAPRS